MEYRTAKEIFAGIEATSLTILKEQLYRSAIRYARIRTDWYMADLETRREMDASRTIAHNAFIDACNILSRNMAKNGENHS